MKNDNNKNILITALDKILKNYFFKRKNSSFLRKSDDCMLILNIQKSIYSDNFYINIAIWLRGIYDIAWPKEMECHIRIRAGHIVSNQLQLESSLNFDNGIMTIDERIDYITGIIVNEILPFMLKLDSITGIKNGLTDGKWNKKALIHKDLYEFLDIPIIIRSNN